MSSIRENIERWREGSQSDMYEVAQGVNRQPSQKRKRTSKKMERNNMVPHGDPGNEPF